MANFDLVNLGNYLVFGNILHNDDNFINYEFKLNFYELYRRINKT